MKLDQDTIEWIESKIAEICSGTGYGYVALYYHIKDGKLNYKEKIARETEKEEIKNDLD